nr:DNA-packaging protein FI [Escherichia coli]
MSGSKADLEQRLAEWEEELSDSSDGLYKDNEEPQQKNETRSERGESENRNSVDMVMVKAVVMLHVNALHATRDNPWHLYVRETCFVYLLWWQPAWQKVAS